MKRQILLSLSISLAIGAFGEARVELDDGWLFTLEEPIASLRMFSIPSMLDMLDGQRRDLIETPCRTFAGLLSALVVATPDASGDIAVTFAAEGLSPVTAHISCK